MKYHALAAFNLAIAINCFSGEQNLDAQLLEHLTKLNYTGKIEATLPARLSREVDKGKADLGRLLFFDRFIGLHGDNSCAGCHSPTAGFADTQSIAIGVDNNGKVGPNRQGPRNQRRTPSVINNAFYPKLMWNGRFSAISGDPFDNSKGFEFPAPEGTARFPAGDLDVTHLLIAQAHIPVTETPEMAGFTGISGSLFSSSRFQTKSVAAESIRTYTKQSISGDGLVEAFTSAAGARGIKIKTFSTIKKNAVDEEPDFTQFDDGHGVSLPPPDSTESRNEPIRTVVLSRLNNNVEYRKAFGKIFPDVANNKAITFAMVGQVIAEFEISLTFANAPLDRFARGEKGAMTDGQKRGAIVFFGIANCVQCHAVSGASNEMFSDFQNYNIGVPQIFPKFGKGTGNVAFRNEQGNFVVSGAYDFGLFDIDEKEANKFKFRTAPLRNLATHSSFFHNGCFTKLEDAIIHHLDVTKSARAYDPIKSGIDEDIRNVAPIDPILKSLDPKLSNPIALTAQQIADLVEFIRDGLLDPRALPENLKKLIPQSLPSGEPVHQFE